MSVFIGYPSFMAYQMMKGKKGNNEGFPSIPGMIARYSALGLTNEQMAENPVWKDLTGNGHDLQMKNFAWKGMSGVGGYGDENYQTFYNFTLDDYVFIASPPGAKHMNFTFRVTGLQPGNKLTLAFFGTTNAVYGTWNKDGIYTVDADIVEAGKPTYFYNGYGATRGEFTIEILPLYPGALVFDGVDDYGVCDNFPILTKEKGYTVVALRQWITRGKGALGLVSNVKNWIKDGAFLLEYRNIQAEHLNKPISFGAIGSENDLPHILTYQTSKSYNGVPITTGNFEGTDVLHVGKLAPTNVGTCINAAIWELVFLDHDATEEELTKIKDYFVKTYPWLLPDQAWTVTGKTNEDEDRATIANITGNGNDLVLSNFGFAGNSGYGDYPISFPSSLSEGQPYGTLRFKTDGKYSNLIKTGVTNIRIKFNLRGMPEGGVLSIRGLDPTTALPITEKSYTVDGLYEFVYNDSAKPVNIVFYNDTPLTGLFDFYVDIIPEYEGYLVTDGVDDAIHSSNFSMPDHWTVVGEWKMLKNSNTHELAGINKYDSFMLYNYSYNNRINVYIHSGQGTPINTDSIKAFTSTGLLYIDDFNVKEVTTADKIDLGHLLFIGYNNNVFTKLAFKNLAIYPTVLSKEDCIKAYNYLQTLKAK